MQTSVAAELFVFPTVKPSKINHWCGLYGSAQSLALIQFVKQHNALVLLLTPSIRYSEEVLRELAFYGDNESIDIVNFPSWEVLPYDSLSPHQSIVSERLKTLKQLQTLKRGVVVVTLEALMQRLSPPDFVNAYSFVINVGDKLDSPAFSTHLLTLGYRRVTTVREHGEFSVKGSIIDVFAMGAKHPFRLDLFDDEIETLSFFDTETQRSTQEITGIDLMPAKEIATDDESIARFIEQANREFGAQACQEITQALEERRFLGGLEFYLPLFFKQTATLFDYLPPTFVGCLPIDLDTQITTLWQQIQQRYQSQSHNRPLLPPERLFLTPQQLTTVLTNNERIVITQMGERPASGEVNNFKTQLLPPVSVQSQAKQPLRRLIGFIDKHPGRILFVAESTGRQDVLVELLSSRGYQLKYNDDWQHFLRDDAPLAITTAPIDKGLLLSDIGDTGDTGEIGSIALITEADIFGTEVVAQRRRRRAKHKDFGEAIKNLVELKKKEPVVHERYGVGRYLGLKRIEHDGKAQDFIRILYADKAKLMVPITSLNLISRYSGVGSEHAPLHRLGSQQWARAKNKAAQALKDVAAELLEIYAKRQQSKGVAALEPSDAYAGFASEFAFEETPDQTTAIDDVLSDMQKPQPMDRLVCGDVGFGKTEIAMRAAFLAVESGRQVAVLVPTTLLTSQHLQTFTNRFAKHPINIAALSRFQSSVAQKKTITSLAKGQIDIVIGTHKLLNKTIKYAALGLVIIDEEHRFGVKQKEKLKALRSEVDILTMTATPIPRTLNMALGSLKDLSVIATPPKRRVAIKTFINEWQDGLIKEALLREAHRGGQVFFVHNDIDSIDLIAEKINKLLPNAGVRIGHAQMPEKELEAVMQDFYHQRFSILVATTIIETGIDVPSANTIIINNAQNFGLAQLHQLRGRVGRSHHQAYAYLIIKSHQTLTKNAKKRLEAIASLEELGAGFMLANHDLEIRGAGELLGEGQSGKIQEIGFALYHDLLLRTVEAMRQNKTLNMDALINNETEIDLSVAAILPETYVFDVHERVVFYKRIASAQNQVQLDDIRAELIERFGLLPDAVKNLFSTAKLKRVATQLTIEKIIATDKIIKIVFYENPNINTDAFIDLLQQNATAFRFDGKHTLHIQQSTQDVERAAYIEQTLQAFAP